MFDALKTKLVYNLLYFMNNSYTEPVPATAGIAYNNRRAFALTFPASFL